MRLLLDSHVFLWWRSAPERLSSGALDAIKDALDCYVSVVSIWELSIKRGLGKLSFDGSLGDGVAASGFDPLAVSFRHAEEAGGLPFHHRDPFDRMLVSQARIEGLTLVTQDRALKAYEVPILWAGG